MPDSRQMIPTQLPVHIVLAALLLVVGLPASPGWAGDDKTEKPKARVDFKDPRAVSAAVDRVIKDELAKSKTEPAPRTSDDDFLRRVSFDLAGTVPSPGEVALFGLDPDPAKRAKLIDKLLESDDYAHNWARYWRDVIFSRATEMRARLAQGTYEKWMADQLRQNKRWDEIATALVTATGDVLENGATALVFAHSGQAPEIAAETSRIFLGIQIQCAECHDHPSDQWKREQFHQLAAFFPRIAVRPKLNETPRSFEVASYDADPRRRRGDFLENPEVLFTRLDRNRDKKIAKSEVKGTRVEQIFERILENGDNDKDGAVTLEEIKNMPKPDNMRRGSDEHFMPDLKDPSSKGKPMEPVFFVNGKKAKSGLADIARRETLSDYLTSPANPWFAKAFVNRMWAELLGRGFYMPVDDMGPQRTAQYPEALELLADGFRYNKYDVKWLFRAIANTEAYQRQIRARSEGEEAPVFAAGTPTRLRADQLFSAITTVLGVEQTDEEEPDDGPAMRFRNRSPRAQFGTLFGYDPSTPQDELQGNVPQALFMMNSPVVNRLIRGQGNTRLAQILKDFPKDADAVKELYMLVLSRDPLEAEVKTGLDYVKEVGSRSEAFEDILWSLLNSSEFITKR